MLICTSIDDILYEPIITPNSIFPQYYEKDDTVPSWLLKIDGALSITFRTAVSVDENIDVNLWQQYVVCPLNSPDIGNCDPVILVVLSPDALTVLTVFKNNCIVKRRPENGTREWVDAIKFKPTY